MNIRLAGFGGQGIVMAGYVLGHGGILDGSNVLQTQSYGSESRGGASKHSGFAPRTDRSSSGLPSTIRMSA